MKSDEGIQNQEPGLEGLEGGIQSVPVTLEVEAEGGCGDDVEIEAGEGEAPVLAELGDAVAELGQGVLGEIDHGGPRGVDLEATEAGGAGGDRDREIQSQPGFTRFCGPSNDADGAGAPQIADEPRRVGRLGIEGMDREGGQRLVHGQINSRAAITWPEETASAPVLAASSRLLSARRSMALRLPRLIS